MSIRVLKQFLLVCTCLSVGLAVGDDSRPPDSEQAARWIRELDHEDYAVRQAATKELTKAGAEVLPSLVEAVMSGSLERRLRVVDLLGNIYSLGEVSSFEPAELALESIKRQAAGSLSAHAKAMLETHYDIREKLAVAAIQKSGGSALYATKSSMLELGDPDENEKEEQPSRILTAVVIGMDWTGGDEGLRHVRRLTRLQSLYWVKKAPVSEEAIEELRADMPALIVQQRGPAYLGVTFSQHPRGCGIGKVQPQSAAQTAGFQVRDVITQFEEQQVTETGKLIELISEKLPGQKVKFTVERGGEEIDLTAELTGWPKEVTP